MINTNDIKKGTRVLLKNGWYATIMDNRKGNIRLAEVEGYVKETGSVYASEIVSAEVDGVWVQVVRSSKQKESDLFRKLWSNQ